MEDTEKIERLEKEIKELEEKKNAKDKVNDLLRKRNQLKFTKLYGFGRGLKRFGSGLADWADKKSKQMEENKKSEKKTGKKPVDLYEEMFGENETTKQMFGNPKDSLF